MSSPIVSIEAIMHHRCKIKQMCRVSNIPGAFPHADMDENVHMLLEGTVAETIMKLEPKIYRKHIWYNKHGKPIIHKLKKPYMEHYKQHYYSGNFYWGHYRIGDSH